MTRRRMVLHPLLLVSACIAAACFADRPVRPQCVPIRVTVDGDNAPFRSIGETRGYQAIADDGQKVVSCPNFAWSSSDSDVASVTGGGVVTALKNGNATITATTKGVSGTAHVTVAQVPVALAITPENAELTSLGDTVVLSGVAKDAGQTVVPGIRIVWSTANPIVAIVDSVGSTVSVSNGATTITGRIDGIAHEVSGTTQIVVRQRAASGTVTPGNSALEVGQLVQLVAVFRDSKGATITSDPVLWSSADGTRASVDTAGQVVAKAPGVVSISAIMDTITVAASVHVLTSELALARALASDSLTVVIIAEGAGAGAASVRQHLEESDAALARADLIAYSTALHNAKSAFASAAPSETELLAAFDLIIEYALSLIPNS